MGDIHHREMADTCHKSSLIPFLDHLAKAQQKTEFVLEHISKEYAERTRLPCIAEISSYAYKHDLIFGSLAFVLADIRWEFFSFNQSLLIHRIYFGKNMDSQLYILSKLNNDLITNAQLLDELNRAIKIVNLFKSKVNNKEAKIYFEIEQQELLNLKNKLESFTKKYNGVDRIKLGNHYYAINKGTPISSIEEAVQQAVKQKNDYWNTLTALLQEYVHPFIFEVPNVFFAKNVLESQNRVDSTIVYTGNNHAKSINKLLLSLGYEIIYHSDELGKMLIKSSEYNFSPVTDKDLDYLFRMFIKNMEK